MSKQLKSVYSREFYVAFSDVIKMFISDFNEGLFLSQIFDAEWDNKELKQRMRHTSIILKNHLTGDYPRQVKLILKMIPTLKRNRIGKYGFEFMFLPGFIEIYGIEDYKTSIKAIEKITQFVSCEFAVRPFIVKYPEKMTIQLNKWSLHKNEHVRRLASEGCRPRLPWAIALPDFKKDPTPILSILENLKNDKSLYVRRSVANNLNDVSKDNPEVVIRIAKVWYGENENTNWIVKHACRTLLKKGDNDAMLLFGFGSVEDVQIKNFHITTPNVKIGNSLEFNFQLENTSNLDSKIRLEYGVHYLKANGTLSKKVFKISEKVYKKNSVSKVKRKQSFKIISTRKFYRGKHQLSIIINGQELKKEDFNLI